jgi:hypothetical protein
MSTVSPITTPRKRAPHSAHRQAFGPGKKRTATQKAADVARSIALRNAHGQDWTWQTYGLEGREDEQALVVAALLQAALDAKDEAMLQAHYYEQEQRHLEDWARLEAMEVHGR